MITEYPYFSYNDQIDALMAPLKSFAAIQMLGFGRMYHGRKRFLICHHREWATEFYANELYRFGLYEKEPQELVSSYNMWDHLSYAPPEIYPWTRTRFNLAHGLTIVKQHDQYSDTFVFATFPGNKLINNFYLNQKELFEQFMASFYKELAPSLTDLIRYRFRAPGENIISKNPLIELTRRQQDCIGLVLQGLSTKEIAKKLSLSPRTVEEHLNNLRIKFKAKNRPHLCSIMQSFG